MTNREELERLAGEYEVCILADDSSMNYHMLTCPSCQEHSHKAEEIENHVKHLDSLSTAPEYERRHNMGYTLNDMVGMPEARQVDAMRDLFDNMAELDDGHRRVMMRTHIDVLMSLPKKDREKLLRTTNHVLSRYEADRLAREKGTINAATGTYNPLKRTLARRMYREALP